jgi:hypothetical protein
MHRVPERAGNPQANPHRHGDELKAKCTPNDTPRVPKGTRGVIVDTGRRERRL